MSARKSRLSKALPPSNRTFEVLKFDQGIVGRRALTPSNRTFEVLKLPSAVKTVSSSAFL